MRYLASAALACALHSTTISEGFAKDGGHDGGGHDGGGYDDNGGDGDGYGRAKGPDQDEALWLLKKGRIISLKTALNIVDTKVPGKVIDVKLTKSLGRSQYRIKVRRNSGEITTIRLDAKTGAFVGMLGF